MIVSWVYQQQRTIQILPQVSFPVVSLQFIGKFQWYKVGPMGLDHNGASILILDFCNHSSPPSCWLEGDSLGSLILQAVLPIKTGNEITIDYHVGDNAILVATYGFSFLLPMPSL
jgi:hypothetical protein